MSSHTQKWKKNYKNISNTNRNEFLTHSALQIVFKDKHTLYAWLFMDGSKKNTETQRKSSNMICAYSHRLPINKKTDTVFCKTTNTNVAQLIRAQKHSHKCRTHHRLRCISFTSTWAPAQRLPWYAYSRGSFEFPFGSASGIFFHSIHRLHAPMCRIYMYNFNFLHACVAIRFFCIVAVEEMMIARHKHSDNKEQSSRSSIEPNQIHTYDVYSVHTRSLTHRFLLRYMYWSSSVPMKITLSPYFFSSTERWRRQRLVQCHECMCVSSFSIDRPMRLCASPVNTDTFMYTGTGQHLYTSMGITRTVRAGKSFFSSSINFSSNQWLYG